MEEYRLLTKDRETISSVKCHNFEEVVEYFAEKKRLSTADLISIFEVESVVKKLSLEVETSEGVDNIEILFKFIEQEKKRRNIEIL